MQDVDVEDLVLEVEPLVEPQVVGHGAAGGEHNPMEMSINSFCEHLIGDFVVVPKDEEDGEVVENDGEETVDSAAQAAPAVEDEAVPATPVSQPGGPGGATTEAYSDSATSIADASTSMEEVDPPEIAPPSLAYSMIDLTDIHVVGPEEGAPSTAELMTEAKEEETEETAETAPSEAEERHARNAPVEERETFSQSAVLPPFSNSDVVLEESPSPPQVPTEAEGSECMVDSFIARVDHAAASPLIDSVLTRPGSKEEPSSLHMSRMHPELAKRIRVHIMENLVAVQPDNADPSKIWHTLKAAPQWTFMLPDFSSLQKEVREVLEKDLIQRSHLLSLQELDPPVINWAAGASPLKPLFTAGDGNCLLHAVSLGMYGVHDRDLALRFAVHTTLTSSSTGPLFKARWLEKARQIDRGAGQATEAALEKEWAALVEEASPKAMVNALTGERRYEYLGQFHIFVLAHVLRRPIIVYADPFVRDTDTKEVVYELPELERIDGIYLPLLWPREASRADPLALCFHAAHFAPLVATCSNTNVSAEGSIVMGAASGAEEASESFTALLPLVDHAKSLLPVHFLTAEEEEHRKVAVLQTYLEIGHIPDTEVLVAKQEHDDFSELSKILLRQYISRLSKKVIDEQEESAARLSSGPCKGGCGFTGTAKNKGYCSVCYRRAVRLAPTSVARPRPSPAPVVAREAAKARPSEATMQCKGGCGYFGLAKNDGYCSLCHRTSAILQSVHTSTRLRRRKKKEHQKLQQEAAGAPVPCRNPACNFHGTAAQNSYCSVCFRRFGRPSFL